jgi:phosphoadenosine phosphosulfate reductase
MDAELDRIAETIEALAPTDAIDALATANLAQRACVTCSFQVEGMVLLHLLRKRIPRIPVLFLDTGYHFPQTIEYRDRVAKEWHLNLINIVPRQTVEEQEIESGRLYQSDPARCCRLRKVEPLMEVLEQYETWFTGLRREQSPTRRNVKKAERHRLPSGKMLLKVNLLADWTWEQVSSFVRENGLSYLPQYDQGFLSIGCQPCTMIPNDPSNPRSGRWGGKKLECGIHVPAERVE